MEEQQQKTSDVLTFRKYDLSLIAALVATVGVSARATYGLGPRGRTKYSRHAVVLRDRPKSFSTNFPSAFILKRDFFCAEGRRITFFV